MSPLNLHTTNSSLATRASYLGGRSTRLLQLPREGGCPLLQLLVLDGQLLLLDQRCLQPLVIPKSSLQVDEAHTTATVG